MSRLIAIARKHMLSSQFVWFARHQDEKVNLFRSVDFRDANLAKVGVEGSNPFARSKSLTASAA
jgi:hypothetical protein